MWVFPGVVDPLVVERGEGSLMGYEWGDKNIVHKVLNGFIFFGELRER